MTKKKVSLTLDTHFSIDNIFSSNAFPFHQKLKRLLNAKMARSEIHDFVENFVLTNNNNCDSYTLERVSQHPDITLEYMDAHPHVKWNYYKNPNLTLDYVKANPQRKWSCYYLSSMPFITMEYVLSKRDGEWNWQEVSSHANITMEDIENNPDLPWDWKYVCLNPNVTLEHMETRPRLNCNWYMMSSNPNITMAFVLSHPNIGWNISRLSRMLLYKATSVSELKKENARLREENQLLKEIMDRPEGIGSKYALEKVLEML